MDTIKVITQSNSSKKKTSTLITIKQSYDYLPYNEKGQPFC